MQTSYAQTVLLRPLTFGPYMRTYGRLTPDERCAVVHARLRELRDHWSFLGEIPYPAPIVPEYTHFAFVRTDSPYHDILVAALTPLIARTPGELVFLEAGKSQ
jgi:hypothetical protein